MARRSFRYVVIDTFPMLDSVLMSILDVTDVAFVVVQGMAPAVAGIARLLPVLEGWATAFAAAARAELQLQAVSGKPAAIGHRKQAAAHVRLRSALRARCAGVDEHRQPSCLAQPPMGASDAWSTAWSRTSMSGRSTEFERRAVAGANGPSSEAGRSEGDAVTIDRRRLSRLCRHRRAAEERGSEGGTSDERRGRHRGEGQQARTSRLPGREGSAAGAAARRDWRARAARERGRRRRRGGRTLRRARLHRTWRSTRRSVCDLQRS